MLLDLEFNINTLLDNYKFILNLIIIVQLFMFTNIYVISNSNFLIKKKSHLTNKISVKTNYK